MLPVFLFLTIEAGLRLGDYGYAPAFFLRTEIGGRQELITNPDFTRRFFPPGLARIPQVLTIPAAKTAGVIRIFVFGESAAMGDPEPAYGVSRVLETLLNARFPDRAFEIVNVAVTAINSHVIREIARDCANKQGDVWVIYMGNNEVVGPFGAGTVFSDQVPPLPLVRAQLAFKRTRVGQLVDAVKWRLFSGTNTPRTWEGMEMFLQQQVRRDDPRMPAVHRHFTANLRDIALQGLRSGAKVVVSSVASNLKDCPPFGSMHSPGLARDPLAAWEKNAKSGMTNEGMGGFSEALTAYDQAAAIDNQYAELQYRRARCLLLLDRDDEAKNAFVLARDLDTLRFRADSALNDAIAQVARELAPRGVVLVDAAEALARESPHHLPGNEFFFEHVHLNFAGAYRLARTWADSIVSVLGSRLPSSAAFDHAWLSETDCAQRLALTDYDRAQILEELVQRLELPPFTFQLGHTRRLDQLRKERDTTRAAAGLNSARDVEMYRAAVARAPGDFVLRERFADMLSHQGHAEAALEQLRKASEIAPHSPQAWFQLGVTLDGMGKSAEAVSAFEEALRLQPGSPEALTALGSALDNTRRPDEAQARFEEALRWRPAFPEARINLAQLLARRGQPAQAEALYRQVLAKDSNNVPAHVNLGKLLAAKQDWEGAIRQYRAALRARPEDPLAHYNLGNALSAQGSSEALEHYALASQVKPEFSEARYQLGLLLAKQGRNIEARDQFASVVRLQPDFAEGHLNYGVALAKERRFVEAAEQFQATLRLQPDNAMAQKFLKQARAMP